MLGVLCCVVLCCVVLCCVVLCFVLCCVVLCCVVLFVLCGVVMNVRVWSHIFVLVVKSHVLVFLVCFVYMLLCFLGAPVIVDLDGDGTSEMVVGASYYYDTCALCSTHSRLCCDQCAICVVCVEKMVWFHMLNAIEWCGSVMNVEME